MIDKSKQRLLETVVTVIPEPSQQIKFLATYFDTTEGHASWLLDSFCRWQDDCLNDDSADSLNIETFEVFSSELEH